MFQSSGILHFDPLKGTRHFEEFWGLVQCEQDLAKYYAWHLNKFGIEVNIANLWGIHISLLKGEEVPKDTWNSLTKELEGLEIDFYYNHLIRFDNGKHAWVDVYSEDLSKVRKLFGFAPKPWFHMTIGRLKQQREV